MLKYLLKNGTLAAVGRGGVLDLAATQVDPAAHLTLESVHRFIRTDSTGPTVPDIEFAELTLAVRRGDSSSTVFDALLASGRIPLHPDHAALQDALAATAAHDPQAADVAVVADTREQVNELNAAIRNRLVTDGRVDDVRVVTTRAGQRIGAGDRIATRRNDRDLEVANRDTWTVTAVGRRGGLLVTGTPAEVNPQLRGVETRGIEPLTPALQRRCSAN
jgi:exodeoxyribonuclease V alpha subunit